MRRVLFSVTLLCGLSVCAAAQPTAVEIFDRSGLPTRPQTDTERQLMRRISAHKPGDMAGAAAIQRDLAAYYRGKGDDRRSRAAQERASGRVRSSGRRHPCIPARDRHPSRTRRRDPQGPRAATRRPTAGCRTRPGRRAPTGGLLRPFLRSARRSAAHLGVPAGWHVRACLVPHPGKRRRRRELRSRHIPRSRPVHHARRLAWRPRQRNAAIPPRHARSRRPGRNPARRHVPESESAVARGYLNPTTPAVAISSGALGSPAAGPCHTLPPNVVT